MEALDELQAKYNKLASEYSKLRAQIPVLKKAFTEEQNKNNSLNEELKLKDQQLRIAESEGDSLHFRNQQLMCRVTVLQDELTTLQGSCRKDAKSKSFDVSQILHGVDEELSKTVAENATLIFTLNEYKERHELEVKALKDEIEALKLSSLNEGNKKHGEVPPQASPQGQKNVISETIQMALEKQLFEAQQALQRTRAERDRYKQKLTLQDESLQGDMNNGSYDNEVMSREQAIKEYYRHKYDNLVAEKIIYKSKADAFEEECKNLKSRLEHEAIHKNSLEELLDKEKQSKLCTREELSTTTENYEIQLSTMSDHLAGLNDIIEEQKNQLHFLQTELQKHTSCKIKK